MAHLPRLSGSRTDRILFLIYLVIVPLMIVVVLTIALVQTRDARHEAEATAQSAHEVAMQTCKHVNRRDQVLGSVVSLAVSLTRSLNQSLTPEQEQLLAKIEQQAKRLRPQDCTP